MIQIKKATLSNFRAKSSLDISMGRRLTLLAGENGSGKTTLLDGLAIGLGAVFSRFPNVKGLGFKNENLKKEAKQTAPFARIALETFTTFQLPVFSYYGVGRALLDVPLRRRGFPKNHSRFDALEGALNSVTRFKSAFIWFYNKEFEESKRQKEERSFDYKLPELGLIDNKLIHPYNALAEAYDQMRDLQWEARTDD